MSINNLKHISNSEFNIFDDRKRAHFVNSLSGVKSVNLVGTVSSEGNENLSVISSAFHLGATPALMGIIIRPDMSPRHTLNNIRENKYFTINHVNQEIYKRSHQTSARYPEDVSECEACGLTSQYLQNVKAPFVKESKIKLSMELVREVSISENGTHLLISKICGAWVPENCLEEDGHLNITKAGTLGVVGLDSYQSIQSLKRLPYAKP